MNEVKERIEQLGRQLGLPAKAYEVATSENWDFIFKKAGAVSWCERNRLQGSEILEIRMLPLIVPGGNVAAISKNKNGTWHILVQFRNNGEERQKDKEIGVPGGASNLWSFLSGKELKKRVVLEHPMLTAYREWREEVGCHLPFKITYLTQVTTTNHYAEYPDAYALSMYYYVEVPWKYMETIHELKGSSEGTIEVIPLKDLWMYKWFPDASECFRILERKYWR